MADDDHRTRLEGMPLDDFGTRRVTPTNTELANAARFQGLELVAPGTTPLGAPRRSGSGIPMYDPQQPSLSEYELEGVSRVKTAGGETMLAMVEPAVLDSFERPPSILAAAPPPPPDPAEEARRIISEARETAKAMLAQAKQVIATERAQSVRDGHAEGYAAGMADADAETAGLVQTCEKIGVHVMEERERVLAEQEADLVELAIAIAERVVGASLDVAPDLVVDACRGAMRKAFQRGSMQVLAHPDDLDRLRNAGPRLAAELGGVEHIDFLEERRLDRGSVMVRTPAGEIDATIRGKSSRIEEALREGIEARRAERRAAADEHRSE